jgi:hypothetical protein
MGEKSLDGLFETLTQGGVWSIRTTNYVEFELHLNQHAVSRECVAERLRFIFPDTYEKDALLSVQIPMMPQALLTDPKLMKPTALGLMEYRETTIVPTQLLVSLLGTLF